ncbi:alanine racemase [Actinomadura latina]|uniref:Amino acid deaminase n=1 Tax=Actinomadura latina TaxID=163603 RepID=A0A846Z325_9ACTN|nr:alanine racemase [Actinomadura latina]NKZ05572.1 amino acid deaminase [Actinomadura latina]
MDAKALDALGDEVLDWRFKAIPASAHGMTVDAARAARLPLDGFGTPLLTLDAGALDHNVRTMAEWTRDAGLLLAPHGKTTMAPALWRRQLDAGAWGITVANLPQLRVARAFGVRSVVYASTLLDPAGLAWLSGELDDNLDFEFVSWVDSVRSVELMDGALRSARSQRPVDVCVELGGPRGRTGVRDDGDAREVAAAVRKALKLRLVGIGGYEGALAHDASERSRVSVDAYLRRLANLYRGLEYEVDEPMVTAGGSAFFDQVADVLGGRVAEEGGKVVLRSGAYIVHDDGFYRNISPFARGAGSPLRSAMHAWGRVVSRPEPALALLDVGKRDVPFDEGLPEPQFVRGKGPLDGARITALNDQHAFLRDSSAEVGDVVRLGLSHPCTAFDKWTMIPVVDDAGAPRPRVVDYVRTYF